MKRVIVLMLLTISLAALWSASAEDILKSRDVIAYNCDAGLFLMDVNTGNEIQITTANEVNNVIWSKDGKVLYRTFYNKDYDSYRDEFELFQISLPSLEETRLMSTIIDGNTVIDVEIALGADNNVYVIGKNHGYDEEREQAFYDSTINSYYNIVTKQFISLPKNNKKEPELLQIKKLKPVVTEGYFIKNQIIEEYASKHYELFVNKSQQKNGEFTRLTKYGAPQDNINLHEKPVDFMVSPNDSVIVYCYYYYYSDPGGDYAYTCAVSIDGIHQQFLTSPAGINDDDCFVWTDDSRLIFSQAIENNEGGQNLCILGKDWKISVLKPFEAYDIPDVFYRYKQ